MDHLTEEKDCSPLSPTIFNFTNELLPFDPFFDPFLDSILNIEIPQFPVKINVNTEDELPSLDQLPEEAEAATDKELSNDDMQTIMNDIEDTVNFTSMAEGVNAMNNPDILFSRIQSAFDTFKEKTGRQMSYSEMRYMMG